MTYVDYIYDIVRQDVRGLDAVYKDYIIKLVGIKGFDALYEARMIESCGIINGRELYVLCEKGVKLC